MPRVDGTNRLHRGLARTEDDGQGKFQRAPKPSGRVDLVVAVIPHARGNLRMGELHQDRAGAGERHRRLAIEPPENRVWTKQPGILV